MNRYGLVLAALAAAALAGCQSMSSSGGPALASAGLMATKGNKTVGEVTFEQLDGKVRVNAQVIGLKPNQEHVLQIHQVGNCASGDGMGVGGLSASLPGLKADAKGRGKLAADVGSISVGSGPTGVVGRGIVVQAGDARLACGVIKAN